MTCLGKTQPDTIGVVLGTGYLRFSSPVGIDGLCKPDEAKGRLELLAVASRRPGNGHFKSFIDLCKRDFTTILIWHVTSDILHDCLPRYGFRPWEERQQCQGEWEHLEGYRWDW